MQCHSTIARVEEVLNDSCFFHSWYSVMSRYFFPVLHCSWNSERRSPMRRMAESSFGKSGSPSPVAGSLHWVSPGSWCFEAGRGTSWERSKCSTSRQTLPPDTPWPWELFSRRSGGFRSGPSGLPPSSPSERGERGPGPESLSGRPAHDPKYSEESGPGSVAIGLPGNASGRRS